MLPTMFEEEEDPDEEVLERGLRNAAFRAWHEAGEDMGGDPDPKYFELMLMDDEGGQVLGLIKWPRWLDARATSDARNP